MVAWRPMRQFGRILLNVAAVSSLVLCVGACILTVAGCGLGDVEVVKPGSPRVFAWTVAFGIAAVVTCSVSLSRTDGHPGLCPACGYDLRATPEKCPECGRDAAAAAGRLQPRMGPNAHE